MLRVTVSFLLAAGLTFGSLAEAQVPAPSEVLGFEPGDDYQLGLWGELLPYYQALAAASDRVELLEIGETVLGEPLIVLFISSPENLAALDRHRENAQALAHAEISEDEAIRISREGKAVVWIDAGLHATEVAPTQMAPLLAHRIATEESEEARKIRDEVILILMPCMNPDGL
ncbi:MAG: peptidase M14, partial [Acidobacteria bacterium]|nr:peptidase M14 [Acidobacteriota bacterium]